MHNAYRSMLTHLTDIPGFTHTAHAHMKCQYMHQNTFASEHTRKMKWYERSKRRKKLWQTTIKTRYAYKTHRMYRESLARAREKEKILSKIAKRFESKLIEFLIWSLSAPYAFQVDAVPLTRKLIQ